MQNPAISVWYINEVPSIFRSLLERNCFVNRRIFGLRDSGQALRRCNRIGPHASGGLAPLGLHASGDPAPWCLGRLFIFARYSLSSRIVERLVNLIASKQFPRMNEPRISSIIERYQTCSTLMLWRYICAPPFLILHGLNLIVSGVS